MRHGPHILVIGESGNGKSTFASTILQERNPRPVLVQVFDPRDKGTPYRVRADRIVLEEYPYGVREQLYKNNRHIATVESWHEKQGRSSRGITMSGGASAGDITAKYIGEGEVFEAYLERMKGFVDECERWYAYVHDSCTFARAMVFAYLTGKMRVNDNQMIWAQATDELERYYMALFPDLPITTIVLAHTITERTKGQRGKQYTEDVYEAALPGRLAKNIFAAFGENYRAYVEMTKAGPEYLMQTATDGRWRCSSQIGVANPLGPNPHWKHIYGAALKSRPEGEAE